MKNFARRDFLKAAASAAALSAAGCATTTSAAKGRVVVIGGGFGGATAAKYLRMWDPSISVTLVEREVPDSAVGPRVSAYQNRGLPVYALSLGNGTGRIYAGAFQTPTEANLLYDDMKAAGIQTSLVFRTGRVY